MCFNRAKIKRILTSLLFKSTVFNCLAFMKEKKGRDWRIRYVYHILREMTQETLCIFPLIYMNEVFFQNHTLSEQYGEKIHTPVQECGSKRILLKNTE